MSADRADRGPVVPHVEHVREPLPAPQVTEPNLGVQARPGRPLLPAAADQQPAPFRRRRPGRTDIASVAEIEPVQVRSAPQYQPVPTNTVPGATAPCAWPSRVPRPLPRRDPPSRRIGPPRVPHLVRTTRPGPLCRQTPARRAVCPMDARNPPLRRLDRPPSRVHRRRVLAHLRHRRTPRALPRPTTFAALTSHPNPRQTKAWAATQPRSTATLIALA